MIKVFGYKNVMAVPRITKVVINVGAGKALTDASYLEIIENNLKKITGQKPIKTRAKKSISSFKIREGMVIGFKVTLRGERMRDFVQKLVEITLPRVHDFRGLDKKGFDGHGNYSLGLKECTAFPEVSSEQLEKNHGLEAVIATTAKTDKEGLELLQLLGLPFKKDDKKD